MNSAERQELENIRRRQTHLHESMGQLDERITSLAKRMDAPVVAAAAVPALPPPLPAPVCVEPVPLPPPPVVVPPAPVPPLVERQIPSSAVPPPEPVEPPVMEKPKTLAVEEESSLELRVGTYWMSRIGIVILLTGLVFLGNYAYHQIVPMLGALGKLSLLGLAGVALAGLGAWLERSRESLISYGRVLMAGGAATLYYTAYAAHFVTGLQVIENPVLGGGLLLGLTGAFMWYADRRRSEAVAVPAVLLAYYTSAINSIGLFTLFSNLLLTGAAVLFLARHRWTRLSFASLTATYGSYAFWGFSHFIQNQAPAGAGVGLTFLACYWVLFTVAVFVATPQAMSGASRVSFLLLNNVAFFVGAAFHFLRYQREGFWLFLLAYGVILLGLAALAARFRSEERELDGAYLAMGLGALTLGFCAKFTGPQLSVILAVESVALIPLSRRRHGWLYEIATYLCATMAFVATSFSVSVEGALPVAQGLPITLIFGAAAWWMKQMRGEGEDFSVRAATFATLSFGLLAQVLWQVVPAAWLPSVYAIAAMLSFGAILARRPELTLPGQGLLLLGWFVFLQRYALVSSQSVWSPLPLLLVTLGVMHVWARMERFGLASEFCRVLEGACATAAVAIGLIWMNGFLSGSAWLVGTSLAAFGTLLYGSFTGAATLAACGQIFTCFSVGSFVLMLVQWHPAWGAALAPIANLALTPLVPLKRLSPVAASPAAEIVEALAQSYRWIATVLFAWWGFEYVGPGWRIGFFAGMSLVYFAAGAWGQQRSRMHVGAAYAGLALLLFWFKPGSPTFWGDLGAILLIPASLRLCRRFVPGLAIDGAVRDLLVGAAMASLWLWTTRWAVAHDLGGQLTAVWAGLALVIFAGGLGLRERIYRLGGFGVLALALGRLFFFDVWRFEALARIVSFLSLGVALLVLSFVYHRFAPTLRRWL